MTLKKILLVEDDPFDARLIRMSLEEIPLANPIVCLETGEELVQYIETHSTNEVCLIILDIRMPVMTGIEALQHLRDALQLDFRPIVVLTSSKEAHDIRLAYDLGVSAFVTKPINHQAFREAVRILGTFWALINERPQ